MRVLFWNSWYLKLLTKIEKKKKKKVQLTVKDNWAIICNYIITNIQFNNILQSIIL